MRLFEIETNLNSDTIPVVEKKHFRKLEDYYLLGEITDIKEIVKNNHNSRIFKINSSNGQYILRSIPLAEKKICEAQCEILSQLETDFMILPVKGKFSFVKELNNKAWMCYRFIKGNTYDGDLSILSKILFNFRRFLENTLLFV